MSLLQCGLHIEERMPKNAPVRDQAEDLKVIQKQVGDKLNFIDLRKTMEEHASEPIYYKTDHHWTSLGAKYAFEEVAKVLDITPADYKAYTVSTTFSGTLASKSGYHGQKDTIEVYEPGDVEMIMWSSTRTIRERRRPSLSGLT